MIAYENSSRINQTLIFIFQSRSFLRTTEHENQTGKVPFSDVTMQRSFNRISHENNRQIDRTLRVKIQSAQWPDKNFSSQSWPRLKNFLQINQTLISDFQPDFDWKIVTGLCVEIFDRTLIEKSWPDHDQKWNRIPVHFIQLGPRFPSVTVDIPPLQNPLLDSADPAFHPNPSRVTDPAKSPWPVSGSPKSFHEISPTEKQALSVEKPDLEISPPVCYRPIPGEIHWLLNQIPLLAFKRTYYLIGFERIGSQNEQIEKFIAPFSANSVHFQKTRKKGRPYSVISVSVCQNTPDFKMRIRQKDTVHRWSKREASPT